jgi:hypothetical protein
MSLGREMKEVELCGKIRFVLRDHEDALMEAGRVDGVRLIPHGDPYIKIDAELVVEDAERRPEVFPRPGVKTAFWPVSGAVMADCEIVGSWARQGRRTTINPWRMFDASRRDAIEVEALSFPIASGSKPRVRWVR